MNRHLFRDLLEGKPELLTRMLASNAPKAATPPALPHWILEEKAVIHAMQRRTRESQPMNTSGFWDYTKDSERLALLPPAALERLALCVASAIFAESIAKTVNRETVLALKKTLGEDLYTYALLRGRYQVGSIKASLTSYAATMPLEVRCAMLARALLETLRNDWPDALKAHSKTLFSQLKLPVTSALPQDIVPDAKELWRLIRKILLRELDTQWTSYFV